MRKALSVVSVLFLIIAGYSVYTIVAERPDVQNGLVGAAICMVGFGGLLVGGAAAWFLMFSGGKLASMGMAHHQTRDVSHHYGERPSPVRVLDSPALPLPSQTAAGPMVTQWSIPPLRGFESRLDAGQSQPPAGLEPAGGFRAVDIELDV
jgi:hypothetical protein